MVGMTSLRKIFRAFGLRRCAAAAVLAAVAVTGCSREDTPAGSRIGETVLVRLPGVSLASPVEVTPGAPGAATYSATTRGDDPRSDSHGFGAFAEDGNAVSDSSDGLFSVTLGALPAEGAGPDRGSAGSAEDSGTVSAAGGSASPATRAVAELSNVWVFQFDASGTAVRCEKVDALAAGDPLEVVLSSGDGYTLGVVAGGPASGLSTSNIPDLTAFREGLLFTSSVASFGEVPYAGTLSGVRVLANGQVQVGGPGTDVPAITLRRCMAQVTIDLTYSVADYALDGVELYNVPVGASFAPDRTAAVFPAAADANFGYRDNAAAGLAPHATDGGRYTWYIGQNRRGSGTGIAKVQDKNSSNAPAYATYARVRTHNTTVEDAPLCYDIYLGEDMLSDFNVTANHVYSYTARITGSAESHYSLLDTDGRVSGKKPQHIEDATVTPAGDIPGEGKPYSLTLNGVLPAEGVEVRAQSGGTALITGTVTASGTAVTLAVPANMSYNERTVSFEYKWGDEWKKIEPDKDRKQRGWTVDARSHNAPATIPGSGGTYTVELSGWLGGNYALQAVSGSTVLVGPTSTSTDDKQTTQSTDLKIPANMSYTERSVTFQYKFNGKWLDISPAVNQQAGYSVTGKTHNAPATIPGQGGTYSVTLTGTLPADGVQVRANISGADPVTGKATASGTAVSLTIPGNLSYNPRTVTFEYLWNGTWTKIGDACTQQGWNVTAASVTPAGDIPQAGGTYTVTLTGWGGYKIRAINRVGTEVKELVVKNDYQEVPNYSASIVIPANTETTTREVTFQYSQAGVWKDIETRTQEEKSLIGELYGGGVIYWVNPDDKNDFRVVALDESQKTWAAGTGYVLGSGAQSPSDRNGADVWQIAKQYSDNKTGGASGTFATDFPAFAYCYNYQGPNNTDPVGTWYLPSKQELQDLYAAKGSVESVITANDGTAFSADYYWSATEYSTGSSYAWHVYFLVGQANSCNKTYIGSVRCVRGK